MISGGAPGVPFDNPTQRPLKNHTEPSVEMVICGDLQFETWGLKKPYHLVLNIGNGERPNPQLLTIIPFPIIPHNEPVQCDPPVIRWL